MKIFKGNKLVMAGVLAFGTLTGLLAPATASAGLVTGNAVFTIDNAAVSTSAGTYFFGTHWGAADNSLEINASTTGGTSYSNTDIVTFSAPVNTNTTNIDYSNAVPEVIRTTRFTSMDLVASGGDVTVGQIGLSGALRMVEPTGLGGILSPFDFNLSNNGAEWVIGSYGAGFPPANVFRLVDVIQSVDAGTGELSLSGNLKWISSGISYAGSFGFDTDTVLGSFSLAPSAVPVPAAVWLFGSSLLGLVATRRKKI